MFHSINPVTWDQEPSTLHHQCQVQWICIRWFPGRHCDCDMDTDEVIYSTDRMKSSLSYVRNILYLSLRTTHKSTPIPNTILSLDTAFGLACFESTKTKGICYSSSLSLYYQVTCPVFLLICENSAYFMKSSMPHHLQFLGILLRYSNQGGLLEQISLKLLLHTEYRQPSKESIFTHRSTAMSNKNAATAKQPQHISAFPKPWHVLGTAQVPQTPARLQQDPQPCQLLSFSKGPSPRASLACLISISMCSPTCFLSKNIVPKLDRNKSSKTLIPAL